MLGEQLSYFTPGNKGMTWLFKILLACISVFYYEHVQKGFIFNKKVMMMTSKQHKIETIVLTNYSNQRTFHFLMTHLISGIHAINIGQKGLRNEFIVTL